MFEKTDKRKIYWLINQYLSNNMSASNFCNEYYASSLEINHDTLTELEDKEFSELGTIASRFDPAGTYGAYTEEELKNKILEIKELLYGFEKNNKSKIYSLIDKYLLNEINALNFCNQFLECYGLEVDPNSFTELEKKTFSELAALAVKYPTFEENFKQYHDAYYTENTLRDKVIAARERLQA